VFASHDEPHQQQQQQQQQGTMFLAVAGLLAPMLLDSHAAEASLLTGRTLALVHPAVMFALLGITLYTGGLGLKVMRARNLVDEIKARKADLKTDAEGNRLPSPLDAEIAELEKVRCRRAGGRAARCWWPGGRREAAAPCGGCCGGCGTEAPPTYRGVAGAQGAHRPEEH
jgi:hypothetical protein